MGNIAFVTEMVVRKCKTTKIDNIYISLLTYLFITFMSFHLRDSLVVEYLLGIGTRALYIQGKYSICQLSDGPSSSRSLAQLAILVSEEKRRDFLKIW